VPPAERQVLLAPDVVAKAAARVAPDPESRWMLRQPRETRRHFAERRQEIWMLTQTDELRESYIEHVLERQTPRPHDQIWMLRQPRDVRESYVHEVLLADGPLTQAR